MATGSLTIVKVRVPLLVGSLAVSAVASVAIGWVVARSGRSDDIAVLGPDQSYVQPPSIGTNKPVEGTVLPDVPLVTLDGATVPTSELVGTPLVLNIWASSCGPCKQELPDFAAAHLEYGDRVRFVGIDYLPPSETEEKFARDRGVQYELLYDADGEFVDAMEVAAFPVTLFVDADGTIVDQTGKLDRAALESRLKDLFG
jgi:thiol-disulfide isomerase/thioredoxin